MDYSTFVPVAGVIVNVTRSGDCCSQMVSLRTDMGIINFHVNADTLVIDNRLLRRGLEIVAYYDSSLPVPLIFPPQYHAQIVVVPSRNQQIMLNHFDRNLLAADQSLKLNIGPNTEVRTVNGQNFRCSPGNQWLLVFYTATTRSMPPQTTPERVIALCS